MVYPERIVRCSCLPFRSGICPPGEDQNPNTAREIYARSMEDFPDQIAWWLGNRAEGETGGFRNKSHVSKATFLETIASNLPQKTLARKG